MISGTSAQHGRGANRLAGVVAPQQRPAGCERVHRTVCGGDVDRVGAPRGVAAQGRRAVDVVVGAKRPLRQPRVGVKRVELGVERADVNGAVAPDGRRGDDKSERWRAPLLVPAAVKGVDRAVNRTPEGDPVGAEGRHRPDRVAGRERPAQPSPRGERVDHATRVARIDIPVRSVGDVVLPPIDKLARGRLERGVIAPQHPFAPPEFPRVGVEVVEVLVRRADGHRALPWV